MKIKCNPIFNQPKTAWFFSKIGFEKKKIH